MSGETELVRVPGSPVEFEVLAGDTVIGPAIARGGWAEDEVRLMRAHLVPGCRVVDLGANVGWFAVQAVLAGAEVDAFEPVPAIAEVCARNLERANAVGPGRGRLHRVAAGEARGSARIALAPRNRGDNRVLAAGAAPAADMGAVEVVEIEVAPVDELVEGPARVLKIDTQGYEALALRGARRLLERSPRLALLVEFWPYALVGTDPESLLRHLHGLGFVLGKATAAPYPMSPERILRQALARDPVRGGIDLYGTRGLAFHVGGPLRRVRSLVRRLRED